MSDKMSAIGGSAYGGKNKKLPQIKKDIKDFLTSEDGKINKKKAAQIAIGVLTIGIALDGLAKPNPADAACGHGNYSSYASYASY